jgi:hypothetical protein
VQAGSTIQLTATARDGSGNIISGQTFTWTSNNTAVATVNSSGVVSGVAAGSATIGAATSGVTGTAAITVTTPGSGGGLLFASDWRTAPGNSMNAVSDGGRWDFVSAEYPETMAIVPSTGLDFPTTNVYQVIATASRTGWSELRHRTLPLPAVGESRYYRWYMRVTQPDGLSDNSTHPIQDNYAENWAFQVINGGGGGIPAGQWRPEFWSYGSGWPNDRWRGPLLNKNQTYRIEMQIEIASAATYRMHVRVYDSSGALLFDDTGMRSNDDSVALSTNPTLILGNLTGLNGITAGCNGIGGGAPFPFTYAYQGAFAVCADGWCGAYNGTF